MSAQPPSSTEFVSDGKGGFTLRLGGAPGQGAPLTTSTETAAQKKVLDVGDIQAQLTAIDQGFRPEFQQYGTKLETVWTNFKSKAGFTVSAEERQLAEDFAAHRANAGRVFSTILNDISGVAVNPEEFKRAEAFIPNPGKGIGDGDSPIEFETKLRAMQEYTKKAMAKYTYITRNGLTINDVDMDDMQGLMNERGDELRAAYGDRGLKGDALKQAVRQQLGLEFGMAVQ
jgi:hypothetical protein